MADPPPALSQAPEGLQGRSTHVWASARAGAACWLNSRLPTRISQNLAGDLSTGSHTKQVPLSDKLPVKKNTKILYICSTGAVQCTCILLMLWVHVPPIF
jgi:hypothetical protein